MTLVCVITSIYYGAFMLHFLAFKEVCLHVDLTARVQELEDEKVKLLDEKKRERRGGNASYNIQDESVDEEHFFPT